MDGSRVRKFNNLFEYTYLTWPTRCFRHAYNVYSFIPLIDLNRVIRHRKIETLLALRLIHLIGLLKQNQIIYQINQIEIFHLVGLVG